jgi:hypothetical protein
MNIQSPRKKFQMTPIKQQEQEFKVVTFQHEGPQEKQEKRAAIPQHQVKQPGQDKKRGISQHQAQQPSFQLGDAVEERLRHDDPVLTEMAPAQQFSPDAEQLKSLPLISKRVRQPGERRDAGSSQGAYSRRE